MSIRKYIFRYKKYILLLAVLASANTVIAFIIPFIIRVLLRNVELKNIPQNHLLYFALTLVGMYICTVSYQAFLLKFSLDFKCAEFKKLFKKLFHLKLPIIQERGPTYYTERILNSGDKLFGFVGTSVAEIIVTVLSMIISLILVFTLNKPLFLLFIALIPMNFLSYKKLNLQFQEKCVELQEVSAVNLKNVINIVQNIEAIKQCANYEPFSKMIGKYIYNWQRKTKKVNQYAMLMSATINFFTNIIRNGILLLTVYFLISNKMILADVIFINLIFTIYFNAISRLNSVNINLRDVKASLDFIAREIIAPREQETGKENLSRISTVSIKIQKFGYSSQHEILKNMQLEIKCGQGIAIVGEAGSGKTTLAKLLMRFYDDVERILINNKDIYTYSLNSLRKKMYLVSQAAYMFPGNVRENIIIGTNEIEENRLNKIINLPFFSTLIQELPNGLNTQIGEGGYNLSGGQKQKIMIARMLMHDPDLIIFDESTSSMDSRSEEMVYRDIASIIKNKIVVKMSHRLSTIKNSDLIIVLQNGEVAQTGSHSELLRTSLEYKRIFGQQIMESKK